MLPTEGAAMSNSRFLARPLILGVYLLIGLAFLFMISPFALYFYSSYGPVLNLLHRWPATSWLTGFFLALPRRSRCASLFPDAVDRSRAARGTVNAHALVGDVGP